MFNQQVPTGKLGLFCNSHNILTIALMTTKLFSGILKLYSLRYYKKIYIGFVKHGVISMKDNHMQTEMCWELSFGHY